eukprot:406085-Amphidinium_carterae.2
MVLLVAVMGMVRRDPMKACSRHAFADSLTLCALSADCFLSTEAAHVVVLHSCTSLYPLAAKLP